MRANKEFDMRAIMSMAWVIWHKGGIPFWEALHRAWEAAKSVPINAQRIEDAKAAAGIAEVVNTCSRWKDVGYEDIQ